MAIFPKLTSVARVWRKRSSSSSSSLSHLPHVDHTASPTVTKLNIFSPNQTTSLKRAGKGVLEQGDDNSHLQPSKSASLSIFFNCLLTTAVEVATISCWYGVWVLQDRFSDYAQFGQERQWKTAVASLVSKSRQWHILEGCLLA